MSDLLQTPLYSQHQALNAKIVDFGGWALPVNYGSQIEEHHSVRKDCGVFDVSHMTVTDIMGEDTLAYLSNLLANDIAKISAKPGKALYSCMLNPTGGVIDDLIVYYIDDHHCRLVTNASTNEKDMAWFHLQAANFNICVAERPELALVAVQGPNAVNRCMSLFNQPLSQAIESLQRFQGTFFSAEPDLEDRQFVGRTGYTGEDGIELIISAELAKNLWQQLIDAGVQPCGLGSRDTLRLEAGMSLYGNDLDDQHTPLESGLAWTVEIANHRDFIGKSACLIKPTNNMIGLLLLDRGVLRGHQKVYFADEEIGEITSGTFSPTLEKSIALARVNAPELDIGQTVEIAVRNKRLCAQVVSFPFVKNGAPAY